MSIDGQSSTGAKNRIGKTQLSTELYRIERERKAEMRMHNTSKQQFKSKHSKLDFYAEKKQNASTVRLYETHNSGFSQHRKEETRLSRSSLPSSSVNYDSLRKMVFTNGEVDIEKVLCLHLLTAHKTETLTPPAQHHRTLKFLAKEQSPLERLIERSKRKRKEDSLTKLLPTYILDVKSEKREDGTDANEVLIQDGRLAERVIINDKIVQLIRTVLDALKTSNLEKMEKLLDLAKDVEQLKDLLGKPYMQEFLKSLQGQTLLSSCESFHLTQPFKATTTPLELQTANRGVENLIKHIRKTVLQSPVKSTWKKMYDQSHQNENLTASSHKRIKKSKDTLPSSSISTISTKFRSFSLSSSKYKMGSKSSSLKRRYMDYIDFASEKELKDDAAIVVDNLKESHSVTSDVEERVVQNPDIFKTTNINYIATLLSDKTTEANKRDMKQLKTLSTASAAFPKPPEKAEASAMRKDFEKQNGFDEINSGSVQRISLLIDAEMKKLAIEDGKSSKSGKFTRGSTSSSRSGGFKKDEEGVDLDVLDLARIAQEIKEKEIQKKLAQFLENPLR